MTEKRFLAMLLALAAGLGTMGAGLVGAAQTQGLEWALPTGTVLIIVGGTIGTTVGTYRVGVREGNPAYPGVSLPYDQRAEMIGGDRRDPRADNAYPGG